MIRWSLLNSPGIFSFAELFFNLKNGAGQGFLNAL